MQGEWRNSHFTFPAHGQGMLACITASDHHNMANSLNDGIMHDTARASLKISTYRESVANTVSIMRSRDELLVPVLNKWPFVPQNTSIKDEGEMIVNGQCHKIFWRRVGNLKEEGKALCLWESSSGAPFFSGITPAAPLRKFPSTLTTHRHLSAVAK